MQTTISRCAATSLGLFLCLALGGCKGKGGEATSNVPPAGEAPAAAVPGAALSNANIAALVNEVNVADSMLAATALPNLTRPEVQNYARQMMGQHHQLHVEGLQVAQQQNITPQPPSPDPFKPAVEAEQAALRSMPKGPAYDSTYIAHEIAIHRAVIDWLSKPEHQTTDPAYQQYIQNSAPVLQQHLEEALALQQQMSGTSGSTP